MTREEGCSAVASPVAPLLWQPWRHPRLKCARTTERQRVGSATRVAMDDGSYISPAMRHNVVDLTGHHEAGTTAATVANRRSSIGMGQKLVQKGRLSSAPRPGARAEPGYV